MRFAAPCHAADADAASLFRVFYAALLILAVIFAPHAYMKYVFAACALIRLNALRRDCALLPHVRRDETVESIRSTRHEKCNSGAVASVAAVVLATTFAVCCTGLSIAALLMAGNSNNAAVFFLVANLTVWGFAALIGRSAYRTARQSAVVARPPLSLCDSVSLEARRLEAESETASVNDTAFITAPSAHWWTDTPLREEMRSKVGR